MEAQSTAAGSTLTITADDYGLAPAYDAGMLAAASAGAIDAVSVMIVRDPDVELLARSGVEVGLHLEPFSVATLERQLEVFERAFGHPPTHLDGHHHCHAEERGPGLAVAKLAFELEIPVRSVSPRHRRLLRCQGVRTADRLLGRVEEDEPALPGAIEGWLGGDAPPGASEWMVHPGHPDASSGSGYDGGRGEDLALLLELGDREAWLARGVRRTGPSELLRSAPAACPR